MSSDGRCGIGPLKWAGGEFTLGQPSPFMSIASGVTALAHWVIPAVVHVNGTARVQTVTPGQNPLLAEILIAFTAITGHPVLACDEDRNRILNGPVSEGCGGLGVRW